MGATREEQIIGRCVRSAARFERRPVRWVAARGRGGNSGGRHYNGASGGAFGVCGSAGARRGRSSLGGGQRDARAFAEKVGEDLEREKAEKKRTEAVNSDQPGLLAYGFNCLRPLFLSVRFLVLFFIFRVVF